jgi:hypothetical protein
MGRKQNTVIAFLTNIIGMIGITFWADSISKYSISFFILGIGFAIGMNVTSNYMLEVVPESHRVSTSVFFHVMRTLPPMIGIAIFLFYARDIFYLELLCLFVLTCGGLILVFFLPESPKYLYEKGDQQGCSDVFNYIAKVNGSKKGEIKVDILPEDQEDDQTYKTLIMFRDYFVKKTRKKRFGILLTFWTANSFCTNLLVIFIIQAKGNFYINALSIYFCEFVAKWSSGMVLRKLGAKKSYVIFYTLAFVSAAIYLSDLSPNSYWNAFLLSGCQFGIVLSYTITYVVTNEAFPTSVMYPVFGFSNMFSRFISVLSPIVAGFEHHFVMFVFLGQVLVCAILST